VNSWNPVNESYTEGANQIRLTQTYKMPRGSWSSNQFRDVWRYAVDTDFHTIDHPSDPLETTALLYGTESRSFPLPRPPGRSWFAYSVNSDETKLAISAGVEIDIYDIKSGDKRVLYGHLGNVDAIGFVPGQPNKIVSSAQGHSGGPQSQPNDKPEIIVWDLETLPIGKPGGLDVDRVSGDAIKAIRSRLAEKGGFTLAPEEEVELSDTISRTLKRFNTYHHISPSYRLVGQLPTSFQSPLFSNKGDIFIYIPGPRAQSNGDDTWNIALYTLTNMTTKTLVGHRDAIMWIGFSPDDSLVASAGWDGTFKIWDASTAQEKWSFRTDRQNWAGVFSPNGEKFLGTDGDGIIRVWNMETGQEEARYENQESHIDRWCRAVDWSPDGRYVSVGADNMGLVMLFDMEEVKDGKMKPIQTRRLSLDKTDMPEEWRAFGVMLSVHTNKFLPDGLKLVHTTPMDEGVEVVDLKKGHKWRIIPHPDDEGHNEDEPKNGKESIQVEWAYLARTEEIMLVTGNAVRLWKLWE
jgi:WD40 repeat protein